MICFCRGYGLCPNCDQHTCAGNCHCDDIDQRKDMDQ